jgi:hypothetical protein
MRALAGWLLALGLAASPVLARAHRPGDDTSAAKSDTAKDSTANSKSDSTTPAPAKDAAAKAAPASMEVQLQELRDLIELQSKQLQEQSEQLKEQQKKMQLLEEQVDANGATSKSNSPTVVPPSVSSTANLSSSSRTVAATTSNAAKSDNSGGGQNEEEPIALHFKGITLTPGGFMAAESVYRSKALSADVNTPFSSIPPPGASNANVSEFNGSGRQSRISMLVEGKLSNVKIGGYYEGDFLGGGSTSNNNQSNSYVFRQRQFWAQAAFDNGFTVTGGQMWSLITQTTHGMDNRTEYLPLTIDAQYHAGFSWARQYGVRFTKNFDNKFWLGFSVENPQTTFKVHGNPTTTVTSGAVTVACVAGTANCPASGVTTVGGTSTTFTNFLLGASGTSGGLYNPLANYSYNPAPDLVFKAVLEPGFGHYELFAVYSRFRDVIFPCVVNTNYAVAAGCPNAGATPFAPSTALSSNNSRNGGGVGGNLMWNLFSKRLDFALHGLAGEGLGRYGSGGLSDATIRPDGTIALLKNYQALGTLVFHPTPKWDIYLNAGGDYASRAAYSFTNPTGTTTTQMGYGNPHFANSGCYVITAPSTTTPAGTTAGAGYVPGSPSNCTFDPRNILEGTLGFWYRFYQGSKGRVQFGMQYSYAVLNTWGGTAAPNGVTSPSSDINMWFTSFRYYLP